jgi:hypothetical protein
MIVGLGREGADPRPLHELLRERARLKVASFPVALLASVGLHVSILALFMTTALASGAGRQAPNEPQAAQRDALPAAQPATVAPPPGEAPEPVKAPSRPAASSPTRAKGRKPGHRAARPTAVAGRLPAPRTGARRPSPRTR